MSAAEGPSVTPRKHLKGSGESEESRGRDGTRLRLARLAQALSQQDLAAVAGVTRQAVAGIEGGHWDPSLRVALALSRALNIAVEDLFGPSTALAPIETRLLASASAEQRVELANVGPLNVALPLVGDRALRAGFIPASGVMTAGEGRISGRTATVRPFAPTWHSVAVAGCDPALPLLAEPLARLNPPIGFAWWPCSSQRALELLAAGLVHAAGIHLAEDHSALISMLEKHLANVGAEVIGFSAWREGLAITPNLNDGSLTLTGVAERGLRLVNRENGSEARSLLDQHLEQAGIEVNALTGYDTQVSGQLLVASSIAAGLGDVGITMEPAAKAYDLDFIPLAAEHSHIVLSRPLLTTPEAQALLRVLGSPHMQTQLAGLPGYDAQPCGDAICSI
ncbi:MAG: helix-turn-helix domain-containing protein [Actinomycetota bacterium]|nr:MAG: helix-turn-helix domain-containing protein [Actinomycetota bacterium]